MPFISAKQELFLYINQPDIWKEWVKKYGHAPGFHALLAKNKRKLGAKKRKEKRRKR